MALAFQAGPAQFLGSVSLMLTALRPDMLKTPLQQQHTAAGGDHMTGAPTLPENGTERVQGAVGSAGAAG